MARHRRPPRPPPIDPVWWWAAGAIVLVVVSVIAIYVGHSIRPDARGVMPVTTDVTPPL